MELTYPHFLYLQKKGKEHDGAMEIVETIRYAIDICVLTKSSWMAVQHNIVPLILIVWRYETCVLLMLSVYFIILFAYFPNVYFHFFIIILVVFHRFVCSDIPELQMAMEMNVLNGHNTKRWACKDMFI